MLGYKLNYFFFFFFIMKKTILITLVFTALNAIAFDCVRTTFNVSAIDYNMYDENYKGLILDSLYIQEGDKYAAEHYCYDCAVKYYWTGNHLDSTTKHERTKNSTEWNIRTLANTLTVTIKKDGDLKKIRETTDDGWDIGESQIYSEKDSLYIHFEFFDIRGFTGHDSPYNAFYFIQNDTLYMNDDDLMNPDTIKLFRDTIDEYKCYTKTIGDSIRTVYEYKEIGDTLVLKKTQLKQEYLDGKRTIISFFVPIDKYTSTIHHKSRSIHIQLKAKPFDLLGRPARNEHSIRVLK